VSWWAKEHSIRAERLRRLLILQRAFDALPLITLLRPATGWWLLPSSMPGVNHAHDLFDLVIAATAHAHSALLYTATSPTSRVLEGLVEVVAV